MDEFARPNYGNVAYEAWPNRAWNRGRYVCTMPNEVLVLYENSVEVIRGNSIAIRLSYEEKVVNAFYTYYEGSQDRALTVVLSDHAKIYFDKGSHHIVSLPFEVTRAMAARKGMILERKREDNNESEPVELDIRSLQRYSKGLRFFTLLEPLGELGVVTSSSTSSFDPSEELLRFPSDSNYTLCATLRASDNTVTVYHVRYLNHNKNTTPDGSALRTSLRRHSSLNGSMATPNTPKVIDAETSVQHTARKRVSSHLMMSIDRMASGGESVPENKSGAKLRKDAILTKLHSFRKPDKGSLEVWPLFFERQEALVFVDKALEKVSVLMFERTKGQVDLPSHKSVFDFEAFECIPLTEETSHPGTLLVHNKDSRVSLVNPFLRLTTITASPAEDGIKELLSGKGDQFIYNVERASLDNTWLTPASLITSPINKIVAKLLKSLKYAANSYVYEFTWLRWWSVMSLAPESDEWMVFVATIYSIIVPADRLLQEPNIGGTMDQDSLVEYSRKCMMLARLAKQRCPESDYSLEQLAPTITLAFHLIHQDLRLNVVEQVSLLRLGRLLIQLTTWMGWGYNWRGFYGEHGGFDSRVLIPFPESLEKPPDLLASLASLFTETIVPYVSFAQVAEEDYAVDEEITPRTFYVLRLFEVVVSSEYWQEQVVKMMADYGISASDLNTYPSGVNFILQNAIVQCQHAPSPDWSGKELQLIGRKDLTKFFTGKNLLLNIPNQQATQTRAKKDINQLLQPTPDFEGVAAWDNQAESDRLSVTKLIFSEDRRFYEITKLLQSSRVQTKVYIPSPGLSEHAELLNNRRICAIIALRTLTAPIGRAALFFSSRRPLTTEKFPIPKMNFSCLIKPAGITVTLETSPLPDELLDWGYFHNGASSGMTISRDVKDISQGWIVFNKPNSLNSQHAGFLLGLGLNGHLKNLQEWQIYNYLGAKHNHTSIGLLLGMAASLKGTMDTKLTKVLSVHIVALLPEGSTNLNVSLPVQIAALVGMGLLYIETQHRRMSTVLLSQLVAKTVVREKEYVFEAYRLAAGIALGFVNLGKGDFIKSGDSFIVDKLLSVGLSVKDIQTEHRLDRSAGGALLALMMMFLKTENGSIADKVGVPITPQLLDYIRPDVLLLRCIAKNMIMWSEIVPTVNWVFNQIPGYISREWRLIEISTLDTDFLPYLNIIAGCCLCIGIKYASTADEGAKKVLLYFLDDFMRICSLSGDNYDEVTAFIGACDARDIVLISCSLVMAATGDLDVFRRARVLQDETDREAGYGSFMSANMALGFLFLGGGQQAFDVSTNLGVAMLLTSIYPVFPRETPESVDVHLQALRHFWCLAVHQRCLVVRDVATGDPVKVNIEITSSTNGVQELVSPCLLPDLSGIIRLKTLSDEYFPVYLDLSNAKVMEHFARDLTVYVYRKSEYKDLKAPFQTLFNRITQETVGGNISALKSLNILSQLSSFEKDVVLQTRETQTPLLEVRGAEPTATDFKLELLQGVSPRVIDEVYNFNIIFNFTDRILRDGCTFLNVKFIEDIKSRVWCHIMEK